MHRILRDQDVDLLRQRTLQVLETVGLHVVMMMSLLRRWDDVSR